MKHKTPHRIRNQSLSQLLAVVVHLGCTGISSRVFVEACKDQGISPDDVFFLHFDTLFDYGFLKATESTEHIPLSAISKSPGVQTVAIDKSFDVAFSLTHSGQEFLHRYGRA